MAFFSFKRKYSLEKKKKRDSYPYIIKMEDEWQRTVRSMNGKVHQTTATTSVRSTSLRFCSNDHHNFAAFTPIEEGFPFQAYSSYMKSDIFTGKSMLS